LWSDQLLTALRANLVYANMFNRDYEGTISRMGDNVRINGIGDVTISNYSKDSDINAPQALSDAQTQLTITQAKYYNFAVDDVDAAQAQPKVMAEAMSWAAYKMALTIDQYLAGFYTDAASGNTIGSSSSFTTPALPTQTNVGGGQTIYDYLVTLNQYLSQSFVPKAGRIAVVPLWVTTLLKQDIRFTSYNTPSARQTIETGDLGSGSGEEGFVGTIDGLRIYESPNAPHLGGTVGVAGSQDVILAGHPMALSFAQGLTQTEAYRPPYRFSDAVKGLCLYGAKTVRPQALAAMYAQHP
jgi:hypothetical protein